MDVLQPTADSILSHWAGLIDDGGEDPAKLELYDTSYSTLLASYNLPSSDPFGEPGAGSGNNRQIDLQGVPIEGVGLANGTAAKYKVISTAGVERGRGNAGTSGTEAIITTTAVVVGQPINLLSLNAFYPAAAS